MKPALLSLILVIVVASCSNPIPNMDAYYESSRRRNPDPMVHAHSIRDFYSPNVLILDSYSELIAQLGEPDYYYFSDAYSYNQNLNINIKILCYDSLGLTYFKYQDSVQLLKIVFNKSQDYVITNDSLSFHQGLTKSQLCEDLKIDNPRFIDYIHPDKNDRYENDTIESLFFIRTKWNNASELLLYFNQAQTLYRIDFGFDNYGLIL